MSIERVREYMKEFGRENDILEFEVSSATVRLAAIALGTEEARIAKTMSFKKDEGCILVITAGDVKIDNAKYRNPFELNKVVKERMPDRNKRYYVFIDEIQKIIIHLFITFPKILIYILFLDNFIMFSHCC